MSPKALTIAGSDSGGGAGIQADLKTFFRFRVYGTSALTLVTAQNTLGVQEVHLLPPELVARQIASVMEDLGADAAKTGALGSAEIVEVVAHMVRKYRISSLVVDPVMVSTSGWPLLAPEAIEALKARLFPLAYLVTPNLPEAEVLLGGRIESEKDMEVTARELHTLGPRAVLLKGGHLARGEAVDLLFDGRTFYRFSTPRLETIHTHGTGCSLSAAITAGLALGKQLPEAVSAAKRFLQRALETAPGLGRGSGPINH
ncbi:MAG: bifunctional hydroxymethylpyrimidine kinase/phosphomethylpyrimidine kinase [Deinococcus sp.]|nr:bifunctional hydroxymethylpyrimidine kinase/phosphomethylpyrimidine kinase [Deinococcus sp.]